jgi:hypothetical protein
MTTKQLGFRAPVSLAIAANATSPDPGFPGVWVWSSTTGTPLYWDGTAWKAPSAGSGTSVIYGTAILDFGLVPKEEAVTTVLTGVVAENSFINLMVNPAGTVDHTQDEHAVEEFKTVVQNIVPGVSFDIRMTALDKFGLTGQWSIRWSLSN